MKRHVLVQIVQATKQSFTTLENQPKHGTVYFRQSATGLIEKKAHIFNADTDMVVFKTLYNAGQLFVLQDFYMEEQFLETELETIN